MKFKRFLAVPVALAMLAGVACGDDDDETSGGAIEEPTGKVTLFSAMEPFEAEALQEVVDELINDKVKYTATVEASSQFEEQSKIRVEGGNPPEVIMYPQPGSVVEQAKAGQAVALEDMGFDIAELNDAFGEYFMSFGEYNGKHYGIPTNINFKSMIWYAKDDFDAKGYTIPKTWDELIALSDKMVSDGVSPWCVGIESGGATGWPATDWMEDIMLRTAGPAVYDKWVKHEIPFNDPAVVTAGEYLGDLMFKDGYVLGTGKEVKVAPRKTSLGEFEGPTSFQLFSIGPDGEPGTEDDIAYGQ